MDVSVSDCDSSTDNVKDSSGKNCGQSSSQSDLTANKDDESEFLRPKPVVSSSKSVDKFKKPILIGPRKPKKNIPLSALSRLSELNAGQSNSPELKQVSVNKVESTVEEPSTSPGIVPKAVAPIEIPSGPLVISDFSDKVLPPEFPYTEPPWKGVPDDKYYIEELKSGVIEKEIDLSGRSSTVLGRLDNCHITMAHPTISRYHAVLQYRSTRQGIYDKGFYLYDLGSTHGTFLNKHRVKPQSYIRIQVGHMMKFGRSTRMFILQGPNDDQEPESEFSVTELKEMRQKELDERKRKQEEEQAQKEQQELRLKEELESRGVDWGMSEDADEETDLSENPYAVTTNEELYAEDPKKELKKWFEREGDELNIETEQVERGKMVCRITLPLDNGRGGDVVIESNGKSKKECTTACCLEACRYIDRLGLFRQSNQEAKKRQVRNWEENDYYDSDEDSYFDRTGTVDEKRQKRMKKAGKIKDNVETYESLIENHKALLSRIAKVERKFTEMTHTSDGVSKPSSKKDGDELDAYMSSLNQKAPNKMEIKMCQVELNSLKQEEGRLVSLINLARPASLPELKPYIKPPKSTTGSSSSSANSSDLPPAPSQTASLSSSSTDPADPPNVVRESKKKVDRSSERKDSDEGGEQVNTNNCSGDVAKEMRRPEKPILGPTLPFVEESVDEIEVVKKPKRSRVRQRNQPPKVVESNKFDGSDYSDLTWQPPQGQTGDGRTSLNDKYGY